MYFNVFFDDGGVFFVSKKKHGDQFKIRFAGNPKFILTKYRQRHGDDEGIVRYKELLSIFAECAQENFSPIVMYPCQNKSK